MASIGLSKPYIAAYAAEGGTVTYTGGKTIGKATTLELSLESGSDNILYGDNGPAETDVQFSGGTLTLGTTELDAAVLAELLGLQTQELSVTGMTTEDATEAIWNNQQVVPYVGFGAIAKKQINNVIKWVGIVYPKVQFQNLNESLETQGETITWNTPTIEATIMTDDTTAQNWKRMSSPLDSEADALLYIKSVLA